MMSQPLPDHSLPWPIPMQAVALIAEYEGLRLKAYRCPAGIWTIGWGRTSGVQPGDVSTKEREDRLLCDDLIERSRTVAGMCTVAPSPNELGAMVSLAYNIGNEGFRKSTVLRQHNAVAQQAAARAFALWNKAKDPVTGALRELPGLTARRAREQALYLTPEDDAKADPMPQQIEPESSLVASPINRGGAAAVGTGVVAIISEASQSIGGLKEPIGTAKTFLTETLGIPQGWILPLVLVCVGLAVMHWRAKQRGQGWA